MTHDHTLDKLHSLEPRLFRFMERLELWRYPLPDDSTGLALTLTMSGATSAKLKLDFQNVRDLQLGRLEHRLTWVLEVRSIRGDQLEGLNYRVVESEEDAVSFYCTDFEARLIQKLTPEKGTRKYLLPDTLGLSWATFQEDPGLFNNNWRSY